MVRGWLLCTVIILCSLAFGVILFGGVDDSGRCRPARNLARFRGIGIGANTTFDRYIARLVDEDPLRTIPDPVNVSDLLDYTTGVPQSSYARMPRLSNIFWVWFQFIDHDLIVTQNGPANDTLYAGLGMMPLIRTLARLDSHGRRQQVNFASPYIDASHVYGNDLATSNHLRRFDGTGKLRSSYTPHQDATDNELLPQDINGTFEGADPRIIEHPLLFSLHSLFLREHNYWCDRLTADHPQMDENELFNTARHIVIGEIQAVTYREGLPALLGSQIISADCFSREFIEDDDDANDEITPLQIFNEFGAAVFRVGHTFITNVFETRNPMTRALEDTLLLADEFFNPDYIWQHGIGSFLLGASRQLAEKRDARIVDAVRKHLFNNTANSTQTIDLMARNIARGRDHQLPSYQAFRSALTGRPSTTCQEFAYSQVLCNRILALYGNNSVPIDLFLGILSERNHDSSVLGIVGTRLFVKQFTHIKHKDHYFYLWDRVIENYRMEIHNTKLSQIILRNTNILPSHLHSNVFIV